VNETIVDKQTAFQQALRKGNRFFTRKNFLLAKREFEAALQIEFDEKLQEKIRICAEEIARQARKEAAKRGRRLEKKGKLAEALHSYQQAAAQETERWLVDKIAELQKKLMLSQASTRVADAEGSDDLETKLAAYDNALAINSTEELLQKKAECLVRLGRFDEAIALYGGKRPSDDRARYNFGYAYAKTGHYVNALEQWEGIRYKAKRLLAEVETLLPFVHREIETAGQGYGVPCAFLQAVSDSKKSTLLKDYERYFTFKYIEELWSQGRYPEMLTLLSRHQEAMSPPLLALYAKIYFKLAENEVRYLESAISCWLTAVYNDQILESLYIKQLMGEHLDSQAIREKLLQSLEALVERYARQGLLSERQRVVWKTEVRIIRRLSKLSLSGCPLELFPCTPAFASQFSLADEVLQFLEERRKTTADETEDSIEVSAYFSEAGQSLMLMEWGEKDKALALIPKNPQGELETYCGQRVLLGYGMKQAREGQKQLKKYFLEALPLLKRYPRYADEIIELVYAEEEVKSYVGLAEVMEFLSGHIHIPKFREATAHAMSIKALELLKSKVTPAVAQRLLSKALAIYPDSHLAQSSLVDVRSMMGLEELAKALKRQNLSKAVTVVNRNRDPRLIDYFFETIGIWYQTVTTWDTEQKLSTLREFHASCRSVDKERPLTIELGAELRRLESK
jgi:tetratricopeptide (TPR) repeat protein